MTENKATSDPLTASSLADRALARLQKIGKGNGLEPDDIKLIKADEQVFVIPATMSLLPKCKTEATRHVGGTKGKDWIILPSFAAVKAEAERRKQELEGNPAWLAVAIEELKRQPGQGWGLSEAVILLPEKSVTLAATEKCTECSGVKVLPCGNCRAQGYLPCNHCQTRGNAPCDNCYGRGEEPNQPGVRCHLCHGTLHAPCRWCARLGYPPGRIPCPICHTKRSKPCPTCGAHGSFSEKIRIECSAESRFNLHAGSLPSGLNRGMDRIGIVNLLKGHAEVETYTPAEGEEVPDSPSKLQGNQVPVLFYRARLPYADLKLNIQGRISTASAFGKRCLLMGVVPFLDEALTEARKNLALVAQGKTSLETATSARAIQDALALHVSGRHRPEDFRQLYPIGFSNEVVREIVINARLALHRTTRAVRILAAMGLGLIAVLSLAYLFLTPLHTQFMRAYSPQKAMTYDLLLPIPLLLAAWILLAQITRLVLKIKFPTAKQSLMPKTGYAAPILLGIIFMGYGLLLYFTKPLWLLRFLPN